jgi:hypothetical protein
LDQTRHAYKSYNISTYVKVDTKINTLIRKSIPELFGYVAALRRNLTINCLAHFSTNTDYGTDLPEANPP